MNLISEVGIDKAVSYEEFAKACRTGTLYTIFDDIANVFEKWPENTWPVTPTLKLSVTISAFPQPPQLDA